MPKILILSILLLALIIAPRGQILAQDGPLDSQRQISYRAIKGFDDFLGQFPGRFVDFMKQGIPKTKGDWQNILKKVPEVFKTLLKFFGRVLYDIGEYIGKNLKNFLNR